MAPLVALALRAWCFVEPLGLFPCSAALPRPHRFWELGAVSSPHGIAAIALIRVCENMTSSVVVVVVSVACCVVVVLLI